MNEMKKTPILHLLIIVTLLVSLAVLCSSSYRLFKEKNVQYEDTVKEVMTASNFRETVMRFQKVGPGGEMSSAGLQMQAPASLDGGRKPILYLYKRVIPDTTNTQNTQKGNDFDKIFQKQESNKQDVSASLMAGINSSIKSLEDIDFEFFDSLMVSTLKSKGIETPYKLDLMFKDTTGLSRTISTPGYKTPRLTTKFTHELPLDGEGRICYYYESAPFWFLMKNISWVLIISFCALAILLLSMLVLSRTIRELNRTSALQEEFTHLVTHNMNNPLSIVGASAESLKRSLGENATEDNLKLLSIISRQTANLSEQVSSILKPYRITDVGDSFENDHVRVCDTLKSLTDQMALAHPEAAFEFKADVDEGTVIEANEKMFVEMMENLMQNAVKYSSENPRVRVSVCGTPKDYCISVEDNGIGIPSDKIKKLFERYYKVEKLSETAGYGLGLYYVDQVVQSHHWGIDVDSKVGEGSNFTIHIPR